MAALEERLRALPRWELPRGSRVICDLHLDLCGAPPEPFLDWMRGLEGRAPVLVVLGDFFDFWVGPAQARLPAAEAVLAGLRRLTDAGTRVGVVHGNRDFLLGESFERATGAEVLPDGVVVRPPAGEEALLLHGDELCTLDRGYRRLRAVVRSAPVRWLSRNLPLRAGLWIARRLRRASSQALVMKPVPEKSMQLDAAARAARAAGCPLLVCGHAHVYREEPLEGGARWLVLDAFGDPRSSLSVNAGGELEVGAS